MVTRSKQQVIALEESEISGKRIDVQRGKLGPLD